MNKENHDKEMLTIIKWSTKENFEDDKRTHVFKLAERLMWISLFCISWMCLMVWMHYTGRLEFLLN
jgi:hypothetical protein